MIFWTQEKIDELTRLYPTTNNADLARRLKTTQQSVEMKGFRLGLKKISGILPRNANDDVKTENRPIFQPLKPAALPDFIAERIASFRAIPSLRK
tara:strand:- start:19 stop:303 length:285 start_codon:yes stop_codon:yes gene_type:complete